MSINGLSHSGSNEGIQHSKTWTEGMQGKTQINSKRFGIQQMDTSYTKPNTTDQKATFLHDTKQLLERREVHEKGVFRANYEGKGFFGSIGQFFKNIKLAFEKKDMGALKNTLDEEFSKYLDGFTNQGRATIGLIEDRMAQLKQWETDISFIKNRLWVMASQCGPKIKKNQSDSENQSGSEIQSGSEKIGNNSEGYKILWEAVDKFEELEGKMESKYNELKNKQKLDQKNFQST